jgi:hypothetical protein
MPISSKIVVFDLDETLGYFVELGIFWEALNSYLKDIKSDYTLNQNDFNDTLDLFPEFIRPNILSVLNYLKYKKQVNECNSVMIYTNNQGPREWVIHIKKYFESKTKCDLFNHIISAFKVNGKQIELCRTSHEKSIKDFVKCSKIPKNTQICFLDDTYYPEMNYDNVYYIKVKPYSYDLSFDEMIKRFSDKSILNEKLNIDKSYFKEFIKEYMENFNFVYIEKSEPEYEVDKIITKKTMLHLQNFFNKKNKPPSPTKPNKSKRVRFFKNKTIKKFN